MIFDKQMAKKQGTQSSNIEKKMIFDRQTSMSKDIIHWKNR